jgi:hypothetical protein
MNQRVFCEHCAREHDYDIESTFDFNVHLSLPVDDPRHDAVHAMLDDMALRLKALGFNLERTAPDEDWVEGTLVLQ